MRPPAATLLVVLAPGLVLTTASHIPLGTRRNWFVRSTYIQPWCALLCRGASEGLPWAAKWHSPCMFGAGNVRYSPMCLAIHMMWKSETSRFVSRCCTACWRRSCGRSYQWHRAQSQTLQGPWQGIPKMAACLQKQAAAAACLPSAMHQRVALLGPVPMALMCIWPKETHGRPHKVSLLDSAVLCMPRCAVLCCVVLCCLPLCCNDTGCFAVILCPIFATG